MYVYTLWYLIVTPNLHIFHLDVINIDILEWWLFYLWINTNVLILPISVQSIVLLEHRIYWYTYKDRYIQFMTWIMTVLHLTCLWWRVSNQFKLQMKDTGYRELWTLNELPILATTNSVVSEHFTAEISTFSGKETAVIQYKQQRDNLAFEFMLQIKEQKE